MGLILNNINYTYKENEEMLTNVNLVINEGEFVAIVGKTGSGKSTLVQMMNALLKPTNGEVYYNGEDVWDKDYNRVLFRGKVGMVFQYPEYQLFESTVIKDVCFGPKNIGMSKLDVELNSYEALKMVGIGEDHIDDSPLELSGGMKRRVAIAGILAMKPEIIILDEPTAGLDPEGRNDILNLLKKLNEEKNITVVIISHSMEDVAKFAKRVIILKDFTIHADGDVREILSNKELVNEAGLELPQMVQLYYKLYENGIKLSNIPLNEKEAFEEIKKYKSINSSKHET